MFTEIQGEINYDEVKDWESGYGSLIRGAKEKIAELKERMRQNGYDPNWMVGECHLVDGSWRHLHHKGDYEKWLKEYENYYR